MHFTVSYINYIVLRLPADNLRDSVCVCVLVCSGNVDTRLETENGSLNKKCKSKMRGWNRERGI